MKTTKLKRKISRKQNSRKKQLINKKEQIYSMNKDLLADLNQSILNESFNYCIKTNQIDNLDYIIINSEFNIKNSFKKFVDIILKKQLNLKKINSDYLSLMQIYIMLTELMTEANELECDYEDLRNSYDNEKITINKQECLLLRKIICEVISAEKYNDIYNENNEIIKKYNRRIKLNKLSEVSAELND